MSKIHNLAFVLMAFAADMLGAYAWYVALFPTEPITIFEATLGGASLMLLTFLIVGLNAFIFWFALAED